MKILLAVIILFVIICIISLIADTHRFVVRNYEVCSPKVLKDTRFVLLCDLHNKEYGKDNSKLIAAIDDAKPDAILIAGDIPSALRGHDMSPAVNLIGTLAKKYPIYYGFGNHEYRLKIYPDNYGTMWDEYCAELDRIGVRIMDNERCTVPGTGISVSALTMERRFYKRIHGDRLSVDDMTGYLGSLPEDDTFNLLIAHDPEYFKAYAAWGADLTVSGHVHGGIMRLPLIGGVISPRLSLFPRYTGGEYDIDGHKLILSCGLGTHTIHVRVFNPGELSVIDIKCIKE